jgi:hypothetical protein
MNERKEDERARQAAVEALRVASETVTEEEQAHSEEHRPESSEELTKPTSGRAQLRGDQFSQDQEELGQQLELPIDDNDEEDETCAA